MTSKLNMKMKLFKGSMINRLCYIFIGHERIDILLKPKFWQKKIKYLTVVQQLMN